MKIGANRRDYRPQLSLPGDKLREVFDERLELRTRRFVSEVARGVEDGRGPRHHQPFTRIVARAERVEHRQPCVLREDRAEAAGRGAEDGDGLVCKHAPMSLEGRLSQSMAFLKTPGIELLYSGVTSRAHRRLDLIFERGHGGRYAKCFDIAVVERDAVQRADRDRHARGRQPAAAFKRPVLNDALRRLPEMPTMFMDSPLTQCPLHRGMRTPRDIFSLLPKNVSRR